MPEIEKFAKGNTTWGKIMNRGFQYSKVSEVLNQDKTGSQIVQCWIRDRVSIGVFSRGRLLGILYKRT